ncbi:MAG: DUF3794 domain-containing protein [Clostridia bacterium]|nr:DUF3794 domain-containing protein [Clostridia bacterium]
MLEKKENPSLEIVSCLLTQTANVPLEGEGSLPDWCDDIHRILRVEPRVVVSGKRLYTEGEKLVCEVFGTTNFAVIYRGEESGEVLGLSMHSFQTEFSRRFECEGVGEVPSPCYVSCDAKVTGAVARVLTKKKCSYSGALSLNVQVYANRKFPYFAATDDSVEALLSPRSATRLLESGEESFELEQEIRLPENFAPILNLVDCALSLGTASVTPSEAGVDFTVNAEVNVAYHSEADAEESRLISFVQPLEIAQHMTSVSVGDGGKINLSVIPGALRAEVLMDAYGARKSLKVSFGYRVSALVCEEIVLPLVEDAYSLVGDCRLTKSTETVSLLSDVRRVKLHQNFTLDCSEKLSEIENARASLSFGEVSFTEEGAVARAQIDCRALGVREEDGRALSIEENLSLPFCLISAGDPVLSSATRARITECFCSARMKCKEDGKIEVELEAAVTLLLWEIRTVDFVSDLTECERSEEGFCGVRFYYPTKEESLWDVARLHRVSRASLTKQNGVHEDEPLPPMLMIVKE